MTNTDLDASGIYRIEIARGENPSWVYIGQAKVFRNRRKDHLVGLRRGNHPNLQMQRAFDKYGQDSFSFSVVEVCPCDREVLNQREKSVLDAEIARVGRDRVLNICVECVGSRLGVLLDDEHKAKIGLGNKGKPRSPEHREAVRKAHLGRKHSEETKRKMSAAKLGNKNSLGYKQTPEHIFKSTRHFLGTKKSAEETARRLETRRKNAEARGYKYPAEATERIAAQNRGRKHTEQHRANISEGLRRHHGERIGRRPIEVSPPEPGLKTE